MQKNSASLYIVGDKIEGPSSQLVFLDILLDFHNMEMRLPKQSWAT